MITVSIPLLSGETASNGVLMIFKLNENTYAATITIKEDGTPYPVDIALYAADVHKDDSFDLYVISNKQEYTAVADAFDLLQRYL